MTTQPTALPRHSPFGIFDARRDETDLFRLFRDRGRPIEFTGKEVGAVELVDLDGRARAAIYRTIGGKFVSEYAKWRGSRSSETRISGKAEHFDTLEDAADWFRPGPLTVALLERIGHLLKPEQIE